MPSTGWFQEQRFLRGNVYQMKRNWYLVVKLLKEAVSTVIK